MVIIFYDANNETLRICTETEPMKKVSINDPNVFDHIPNDDILYIEDAHFVTKPQFKEWLRGDLDFSSGEDEEVSRFQGFMEERIKKPTAREYKKKEAKVKKWYIHPTTNGTIVVDDIKTKEGQALILRGKWHFVPLDSIGGEGILEESRILSLQIAKGRISVVDEEFYQRNKHKGDKKKSPAEAALDSILVPAHMKAEAVASGDSTKKDQGGAIEIVVD